MRLMAADELETAIERYHAAAVDFVRGDPESYMAVWSRSDDVSVANPFDPVARGWAQAAETMERAASRWREGEVIGFERLAQVATGELAFILEIERYRAKIGGRAEISSVELRVTSVFRLEGGAWKVVHRHADPITTPRPAESVIRD
jgi:ketosteroid isomerase-like protein